MIARVLTPLLLLFTAVSPALHAMPGDGLMKLFGVEKAEAPTTVKVLVGQKAEGAMLQVTAGHNVFNPYDGRRVGTRFMGKNQFIRPTGNGLHWGEEFPQVFQLLVVPDSETSTILIDGVQYAGSMYIYQVKDKIYFVNELPVESYMASILATRFDQALPDEAMNAIAICARTQVAYQVENPKNRYWHVDAREVNYQGYSVAAAHPHVQRALNRTKGMIMTNTGQTGRQEPFLSEWTTHCAGKTVPYHVMYRQEVNAPRRGAHSPFAEQDRQRATWTFKISKDELAQAVDLESVSALKLFADQDSGKVYAVRLESSGLARTVDFITLQKRLGKERLHSSDFTIAIQGNEVSFTGVGKGSGVGLCLYSAVAMAQRGQDAGQILAQFFPHSHFEMWKASEHNEVRHLAEEDIIRNRGMRG